MEKQPKENFHIVSSIIAGTALTLLLWAATELLYWVVFGTGYVLQGFLLRFAVLVCVVNIGWIWWRAIGGGN